MDDFDIRLEFNCANRGKFPVRLMRGREVLVAGQVNPHNPAEINAFVQRACEQLPGVQTLADDLTEQLLQLAASALERQGHILSSTENRYQATPDGIIHSKPTPNGPVLVRLTNFTAQIVATVARDDGSEIETAFEIAACLGGKTYSFIMSVPRFMAMKWPEEQLGAEAIVSAGVGTRDHARAAIQSLSPKPIPRRTLFTHTGWHQTEVGWIYLHAGGAIGPRGPVEGVQVELPDALALYRFADPLPGGGLREAIRASIAMLELAPDAIILPVFCAPWRAVLGSCDFGLHIAGPTGVFKSELAAQAQQFFGPELDSRHLPASWSSTENALEGLLFVAKDVLVTVDDFAPCGGPSEVAAYHQRANRVFRAQGNRSGRGRMRADASLCSPQPPRGVVLSTGEEIPNGQSIRARTLILELSGGDIDASVLTLSQKRAQAGEYASALNGFIRYVAERYESIQRSLRDDVEALRNEVKDLASHCRTPGVVANLAFGLRHFIAFAQDAGALTEAEGSALWQRGWSGLLLAASQQAQHQLASEPAQRFLELVGSALASGRAHLADSDGNAPDEPMAWGWRPRGPGNGPNDQLWLSQGIRIGWVKGEDVFLDPNASFHAAQEMASSGDGLNISARTLRKRLDEKGLLVRAGNRSELLCRRMLEGRQRSVLQMCSGVLSARATVSP